MSIFEPIPREPRVDDGRQQVGEASSDDDSVHPAGSLDPRSIRIAGVVVVALVIAGIVASNTAGSAPQPRPTVAARVDPGAAEVEQAEAKQTAPTRPSASPSAELADQTDDAQVDDSTTDDSPTWQSPDNSTDDGSSGDFKWDRKPGKGHGRGRG